jgi:hypothetical protein
MQAWGNVSHLTHLGGILVGVLYVKAFPLLSTFLGQAKARADSVRRAAGEKKNNAEKNYFENVIDPILKKISDHGMESLTKEEKKALEEASKRTKRNTGGRADSDRILPFRRP